MAEDLQPNIVSNQTWVSTHKVLLGVLAIFFILLAIGSVIVIDSFDTQPSTETGDTEITRQSSNGALKIEIFDENSPEAIDFFNTLREDEDGLNTNATTRSVGRIMVGDRQIAFGPISEIKISPLGKYVAFKELTYVGNRSFVIDVASGKDILKEQIPTPLYGYEEIEWIGDIFSSNDEGFVVTSRYSSHDGSGETAVYLWRSILPSEITVVAEMSDQKKYDPYTYWYDTLAVINNSFTFVEHSGAEAYTRTYDLNLNALVE